MHAPLDLSSPSDEPTREPPVSDPGGRHSTARAARAVAACAIGLLAALSGCDGGPTAPLYEDHTPPSAPQGLCGVQVGTSVQLDWQRAADDGGILAYVVHRNGTALVTTADTVYVDRGVSAGHTYAYRVQALDYAGNVGPLGVDVVVRMQDVTAPSTPQGLQVSQVGTALELSWLPSADDVGVAQYALYRDGILLAIVTDVTHLDAAVSVLRDYRYQVRALDGAGNESPLSEEVAVTVHDVTAPSVPQEVEGRQVGMTVELLWRASTDDVGVTEYVLHRDGVPVALLSETRYVDAAVKIERTYRYSVVALDAAANASAQSEEAAVTVRDISPPSTPQGLEARQVGTSAELSWAPSSDDVGVVAYVLYRNGGELATVTDTTYVDAAVVLLSDYRYRVEAVDAAGNASAPSEEVALSIRDIFVPTAPQGLVARQAGTAVELDWQPATDNVGVVKYRISRNGMLLVTVTGTDYVDRSVAAETLYRYEVRAVDAAGNASAPSAQVAVTVQDVTAPTVPQGLVAEQEGTTVELDWQGSSDNMGVTGYRVVRNGSPIATVTSSSYVDGDVAVGTTYRYVVRALDAAGNVSGPSGEVAVTVRDVTPPRAPLDLSAAQQGTKVELDWEAAEDDVGVTGYRVYRNGSLIATVTATSYVDGTVLQGSTYRYAVRALDAAGNVSLRSKEAVVTVADVTAPSVPQGVVAQQVGAAVDLRWLASSDNLGVTQYRVYRNNVLLASVTGTTYVDGAVAPNITHGYAVSGRDAAGNESARSATVSITVQPSGGVIALSNITSATTGGPSTFAGHAASFADVTGDGLPDLYVTRHLNDVPVADLFYRNLGGGSFAEEAATRGIDDLDLGSHGAVWADLDNDGDYDLYNGGTGNVAVGGDASDVNNVYRRNANGAFTDVTPAGSAAGATRAVLALDLERDGDLDLLAVNGWQGWLDDQPSELFNEIYRNDGGLDFTYLSVGAFQQAPAGQGAVGSDFDGDGDVDVFAANLGPLNVLENVAGSFVQRSAASIGISATHEAHDGVSTADVNNDGHVDLLLAGNDYGHLYLNDGDGTFTHRQSFTITQGYMGGFADLDHDGDLDLVFAGDNRVFVNDGSGSFPTTVSIPIGAVNDPRSIAFADIDDDGDLDFFVTQKRATNRLIRNDYAGGNRWLKVRLTGNQGQAGAFGATVRVYLAGTSTLLAFREARAAYGYVAQDEPVIHVGLGGAARVDVVVRYPNGSQTRLDDVATNALVSVGP
jgi:fibronectin type 3 domain-containing protein